MAHSYISIMFNFKLHVCGQNSKIKYPATTFAIIKFRDESLTTN